MRPLRRDSGRHAITGSGSSSARRVAGAPWHAGSDFDSQRWPAAGASPDDRSGAPGRDDRRADGARGTIELVDYDPAWPAMFEREAVRIRAILGDLIDLLEHVGSTSVPELAAKPIIDNGPCHPGFG